MESPREAFIPVPAAPGGFSVPAPCDANLDLCDSIIMGRTKTHKTWVRSPGSGLKGVTTSATCSPDDEEFTLGMSAVNYSRIGDLGRTNIPTSPGLRNPKCTFWRSEVGRPW